MRALILEHAEHETGGLVVAELTRAGVGCDVARSWRGEPPRPSPSPGGARKGEPPRPSPSPGGARKGEPPRPSPSPGGARKGEPPRPSPSPGGARKGEPAPDPNDDDGYDLLVVLGGAMAAWEDDAHPWLAREAALLARRARADRPTLAICLGAQLLARGLGAANWRGPTNELGLMPIVLSAAGRVDPLLAPFDGQPVLHWHHDTFALPPGATLLASSNAYAHQAFRLGQRVYGVQFHVECDRTMRRDWAARGADELRAAGVDPAALAGDDAAEADRADANKAEALDRRGREFARALLQLL